MDPEGPTVTPVLEFLNFESSDVALLDSPQLVNTTQVAHEITWNQLKNCYASAIDDYQELADLLNSWNLADLYDFFVGK